MDINKLTEEVIQHWFEIYTWFEKQTSDEKLYNRFIDTHIGTGAGDCSYCIHFYGGDCISCPIMHITGEEICGGTPYHDFMVALENNDLAKCQRLSKAMYEFLLTLRKAS